MMEYKYNPADYEEVLCEYMTAFYRAYEATKYAMKEGDISESDREEMLAYFEGLIDD